MREIKFRELEWDYDADEFIKWHHWGFMREGEFIGPSNPQNTQCQFTGLHDKNGKEGFDGDIVASKTRAVHNWQIVWANDWGKYVLMSKRRGDGNIVYASIQQLARKEIIGNIYENPELLN